MSSAWISCSATSNSDAAEFARSNLLCRRCSLFTVRSVFRRIIAEAPPGKEAGPANLEIFANQSHAERALADLAQGPTGAHISPRTRQVFRKLRPLLLERLAQAANPDAALNQFV